MNQHRDPGPADPFDRLRAADPAADVTPDRASLEAAVRARVDTVPDELAAARSARRPSRWLAVAAVAAGTLVVGSAGYALGDRSDGDLTATEGPATSEAALPGVDALAPEAAGPAEAGRVAGGAGPVAESSVADSMPWFGDRTVFTAQGLSDAPGTAAAWTFDPRAVFAPETAARVASALGLTGEPRLEGGAWVVGALDGSGPNLQLMPDGTATVAYYDPTRDPWGCPVLESEAADPAEGGGSPEGPDCAPPDFGPAPQGDAAIARARELLAAAGVDPDAFEYEVMDSGMPEVAYVTAYGLLAGERTGLTWNVTLVGDGVQSLYGYLAPIVPLGDYEVISPNAAVARLADPRFSSVGGPIMAEGQEPALAEPALTEPSPDRGDGGAADAVEIPAPPAAAEPGSAFAWPVNEVVLTSARLDLVQQTEPDGAAVLVPAYELSNDDGMTWSMIAVTDAALDFSPVR